ncbi:MAG TPA: hypothetical protein VH054_26580 [Polyangiaceae bacterium]|jgi:hypothetical protein|nr:hypothetical protein [Polyangiaceae bacterium]
MRWTTAEKPTSKTLTVGQEKKQVTVAAFSDAKGVVEEINGTRNARYFERSTVFVGGAWHAVGFYGLATAAWDGAQWRELVDEEVGKMLGEDDRTMAVASDGARAWAVSCAGAVHEWTGKRWERRAKSGGEAFKGERHFARVAWDHAAERLVLWGGNVNNRASNDTLLFDGGVWQKSTKPGTKLSARKADNYWLYDDHARGVVRIGTEGCSVLDGKDAWKPLDLAPPPFIAANGSHLVIAHDPASKKTLWLDPIAGNVYAEGKPTPIANVGQPPGLVARQTLTGAGAYFWNDFDCVNDTQWLWGWDASARRAYGFRLKSSRHVCTLDLATLFA